MSEDNIWTEYAIIAQSLVEKSTDPDLKKALIKIANNPYDEMKDSTQYDAQEQKKLTNEIELYKEYDMFTMAARLMVYRELITYKTKS